MRYEFCPLPGVKKNGNMKQILIFGIPLLLLVGACERVNKLSDEAAVERFTVLTVQPADAQLGEITIDAGNIRVEVTPREGLFPLTFNATTKVSGTTVDVVNFPGEFKFETGASVIRFYAISASGVAHPYEVSLKAHDTGAEILGFAAGASASAIINPWNATVQISADKPSFPYEVILTFSPTASEPGETITFQSIEEVKEVLVRAADGSVSRTWKVYIDVQLPDSDFESWKDEGTNNVNINSTVWGTANNSIVRGTLPVAHNDGKAAEMTTGIQTVPLFNHRLITAGTLYTGYFKLGFDITDPRSMTFFGVPHKQRVNSISFDARYVAGPKMQQSIKKNNNYVVEDIQGHDSGEAWAEIIHWSGNEELKYHGSPINGLTVLGRGQLIFDGLDTGYNEWSRVNMPIEYTNTSLSPTHIVIVFTSSREGDLFKGAPGSKLAVDNIFLNY
jgi:hypothetical protein